jgi:hypothetical protein
MANKSKTLKTSLTTKTGRKLLGPLNIKQLIDLKSKTTRGCVRNRIQHRIDQLVRRGIQLPEDTATE